MFNFLKKKYNKKIKGEIGYFKLEDWWINSFNDDERNLILSVYSPFGIGVDGNNINLKSNLIDTDIEYESGNTLNFLVGFFTWFSKKEYYDNIAPKIINEIEYQILNFNYPTLDLHFAYGSIMAFYYKNREKDDCYDKAIYYCKKQIELSKESAKGFMKEFGGRTLPGHMGYKQLSIILEKEKKYEEALFLIKKANEEGWRGDWEKRIERINKKMKK
ncbi:hypothetical protein QTH81_01680 [Clostridium perfringens]|nr:hypothetical protein [Clostridium perfringens]MDM0716988.1 hypothetical protein [Clostridium perfringens]MDM0901082.1 hypothetical protein [Clostridium perfringens]